VPKFLHARHVSAGEILCCLVEVNGEELMSLRSSDFSSGEVGLKDNERIGRLTAAGTPKNKTRTESVVLDNRRVSVSERELQRDLDLSHRTIFRIIQEFAYARFVCNGFR
jgi:hypothetical protein